MKVLELDKFVAHLNDEIKECGEGDENSYMQGVAKGTKLGLRMAIAFAATIAREENAPKEGTNLNAEWPSLFECSVCHWSDGDTYTGDTSTYNFCPNCGAKMKGGD